MPSREVGESPGADPSEIVRDDRERSGASQRNRGPAGQSSWSRAAHCGASRAQARHSKSFTMGRRWWLRSHFPTERLMLIELSTHRRDTPRDLVDLLGECHARIRRFVELAHEAAIRMDAPVEQVIQACADVERYFVEALPLHVADEEESIAPRLKGL